jgi:hypothetical protein
MKILLRGNRWILNGCDPAEYLKKHKYVVRRKNCDDKTYIEAHNWCYTNANGTFAAKATDYTCENIEYYFENKDDAMMFKLIFGGIL